MTSIFLFCTSDVPASTINQFMTAFSHASEDPNIFCLVRTPDQEEFDEWGTEPPVHDFTTGFRDATDTDLRLYTQNRIDELKHTDKAGGLSPVWVAKLDERSPQDSTVVLQYRKNRSSWTQALEDAEEEFGIPDQADVDDQHIWWKWRVSFADSFQLFNSMDDGQPDIIRLYTRPEFLDPEGVLHVDVPRKIIKGEIPDPITESVS
ncbi:uncharacterized protein BO80DRAFT_423786 [Aspergillus ibericus CBS 121593]|uniref:Uncharacterized protein n=1 Tax=Aspergillus ibericus CBS 121593 TaxID=1448316 RepID=A0A395H3Q0_9EURO|nr:hypothetical protein BO80DRAFT_423786 [Aspergillus ibericus CBS 121593]RAL02366.1 hypothetical protein BO80DRAFT_423786 [Aspergillus ibericus CBS 121593]